MGSHIFKQDEKAYYNYFDWCFDCKQVKGMKSNANKLLIYKWLNSYILNFPDFVGHM